MADSDEASKDAEAKAAYEMIKDKMNALKGLNVANSDVKRLQQNVNAYVRTWYVHIKLSFFCKKKCM